MQTLLGIFTDRTKANSAITELERKGYDTKDISVVVKDEVRKYGIKGGSAVSGTVTGLTAGAILGGIAGILIGTGAIVLPGVGALLIGGPLAAALGLSGVAATAVSAAATGGLAGGLVGALVDFGLPEDVARDYEKRIKEGAVLLAVSATTPEDIANIRGVFQKHNADQIRSVGNGINRR